jgi:hypothetical protein
VSDYAWIFGSTTANSATSPVPDLTAGKLLEVMRQIERDFPPLPSIKFDLFGSDLVDGAYELNCPDEFKPPGTKGWRTLVVPKAKIDWWAYELRRHGAEVRVEPRIRATEPQDREHG